MEALTINTLNGDQAVRFKDVDGEDSEVILTGRILFIRRPTALNRALAAELWPILKRFAETGELINTDNASEPAER